METPKVTKTKDSGLLPGDVTPGQIEDWKKKYRNVYKIEVPADETYDEWYTCYVREPRREILNDYLRKSERVPIDAALGLIRNTWLGGDEEVKKQEKYALSAVQKISKLIIAGEARLEKL